MRKWLRNLGNLILVLLFLGFGLEILYRYQVVDAYAREYQFLNEGRQPDEPSKSVLVMGDSFTAVDSGWVDLLRSRYPQFAFHNAGIPGTGAVQAAYTAPRRFRQAEPDAFIYQIYLGNDLFDISNPVSFRKAGFARSLYWAASNRLRSLGWLNYKLGQFRAKEGADPKQVRAGFDPAIYNARDRRYTAIEADWLAAQLSVDPAWESAAATHLAYLQDLLDLAAERDIPVLLLAIPHCAQLGPPYAARMAAIGMQDLGRAQAPLPEWCRRIDSLAQDNGADFIFLRDALMAAEYSLCTELYYQNDPHLQAAGQLILAAEAARWIDATLE